ncbi:hypothetical protein U6G28_11350 [Actinomycetaceae bacterium MB13-C1-2]|nr:hypothetical protein U6G28_11350 [Actinomycetaceae bacterium MB13-C1-2]
MAQQHSNRVELTNGETKAGSSLREDVPVVGNDLVADFVLPHRQAQEEQPGSVVQPL